MQTPVSEYASLDVSRVRMHVCVEGHGDKTNGCKIPAVVQNRISKVARAKWKIRVLKFTPTEETAPRIRTIRYDIKGYLASYARYPWDNCRPLSFCGPNTWTENLYPVARSTQTSNHTLLSSQLEARKVEDDRWTHLHRHTIGTGTIRTS